jgi:hypothetical protein
VTPRGRENLDETGCAAKILTTLARHAYRRSVTPEDVQAPMAFYRQSRQSGRSFDNGIRVGVARLLSSPRFLYRIEKDSPDARAGAAHPVSGVELASRLYFFLRSSIPDEKLLDLALAGRLREPGALTAEVRRNCTATTLPVHLVIASSTPAGFALENFDPVGRWRETGPDGVPLDVAGTLADGSHINGSRCHVKPRRRCSGSYRERFRLAAPVGILTLYTSCPVLAGRLD